MTVRITEIAEDLGLAHSTVAQALGGRGTISQRTRQLVLERAAVLGYMPNRNAQRMRSAQTGVIGLIVPDVVLSPYVEVVQHLFRIVESRGLELQIALSEFDADLEDRAIKSMLASRVDGIIAKVGFPRWEDVPANHTLRRAKEAGVPVVLYSNPIAGSELPYLKHPLQVSAKLIVRHLFNLGHRRISALVPGIRPFGASTQGWLASIREELVACGGAVEMECVSLERGGVGLEGPRGIFSDYMNQNHPQHALPAGRELFCAAMALDRPPTAMIAYSDSIAIGAVMEAQVRGLRLGHDIAIAGCGQMATSYYCPVSLTTVDRRPQLYAEKLLDLLVAHMSSANRDKAMTSDEIEPLLVIGESTIGLSSDRTN